MKEIKLKECPCCGGKAKFMYRLDDGIRQVRVVCNRCNLSTEGVDESLDYCAKEEAAKVWNRREKEYEFSHITPKDSIDELRKFLSERFETVK